MKDLLGIRPLNPQMILDVLDRADGFLPLETPDQATLSRCAGRTLVNLFFEASTRTRTSFELAAKRLGMEVVNLVVGASSVTKGETLRDTILTLDAMRPDAVVVRHSTSGVPAHLANFSQAHFINAGDGAHEHPTQALLDALTIRRHFGKIAGLTVAILGDVLHSRVARSNVHLLTKLGAQVRISGPRTLLADGIEHLADGNAGTATVYTSIQEAVTEADAIMMLRIQRERQNSAFLPTLGEYFKFYGLNQTRLQLARPNAIVLHPGPINRNVEIASEIADSVQSKILEQVQNGVAVRMAVLEKLLHS
ncbi:MAG TPA: aspartate carbamoyltransferase catalytic subunit [Acidobacteriota bacterium]|nr:aspartate carbamoyltransferase catalytic subunit [Acidobacteriota bacterium]HNJ42716.1 aspartate carbamoyltransferase catalytic subunit [Acidobacteriota bacterium]